MAHQQLSSNFDKLRSKVGVAKTTNFRVVGLSKSKLAKGTTNVAATGWVLERSKTCDTPGEGSF